MTKEEREVLIAAMDKMYKKRLAELEAKKAKKEEEKRKKYPDGVEEVSIKRRRFFIP